MKRSTMVQLLRDSILNHMNCQDCCETDEDLYSRVLEEIENSGMLPPSYKDFDYGYISEWESEE